MASRYEEERKRIAALPRAERFEELLDFPVAHTFKVIGRTSGFSEALQDLLTAAGHPGVCLTERPSAQGTYLSITFILQIQNGRELDSLYTRLEALPGLAYLL